MRAFVALLSAVCVWLAAASAWAHVANLSQSDFTVEGANVRALVVFAKADAVRLGKMDTDGDGTVTPAELEASQPVFRALVERDTQVTADEVRCAPTLDGGGDVEADGFGLSITFACKAPPREIEISMGLLRGLLPGHRHMLRLRSHDTTAQATLTPEDFWIALALAGIDGTRPPASARSALGDAVRLGLEHIFKGWDHLLFLLALLLGTRAPRSVLLAVSTFTVAHSLTLALAALGAITPSPRFVEPAIAASIACVAFENVWRPGAPRRWRLAFAFGLVHGFGFAGSLRALALPRDRLLSTLFGFNVGVELGQLLLVAAVVPILALILRGRNDAAPLVRGASIALGFIGIAVFVARVAFPS